MKTLQWRLRKEFRREVKDQEWRTHSEARDAEVKDVLCSYNANDRHFEYREEPINERNEQFK